MSKKTAAWMIAVIALIEEILNTKGTVDASSVRQEVEARKMQAPEDTQHGWGACFGSACHRLDLVKTGLRAKTPGRSSHSRTNVVWCRRKDLHKYAVAGGENQKLDGETPVTKPAEQTEELPQTA